MVVPPLVSVISTSYNHGRYLRETLDSVAKQSYPNIQHIVIDGGSTDETVSILKTYPSVEWVSEPDNGPLHAVLKGIERAKGAYIMFCPVTDGYMDMDWIRTCVEVMEKDLEVSLVWGLPQYKEVNGELGIVSYPEFARREPPQKELFLYHWLTTGFWLPEGNFCVRADVFRRCYPSPATPYTRETVLPYDPWLEFNYQFNMHGYLPKFVRTIANFGRRHENQRGQLEVQNNTANLWLSAYYAKIRAARATALTQPAIFCYRDSANAVRAYTFSRVRLLRAVARQFVSRMFWYSVFRRIRRLLLTKIGR